MSSQYSGIFLELLISSARSTKVHSVLAPSRHPVGSLSEGSLSELQQRRQREHPLLMSRQHAPEITEIGNK